MIDARLQPLGDGTYDLVITNGDLELIGGDESTHQDAVLQDVAFAIGVWMGECAFDQAVGFPWREAVFGLHPIEGIGGLLQAHLTARPGVAGLTESPNLSIDSETGRLTIVAHIEGNSFSEVVEIGVSTNGRI